MRTFLEFFAGAGLARIGLEDHFDCVWANDIDPRKANVYRSNFGDKDLHEGDIKDVDAKMLPPAMLAWASFPCQDLSLAGRQRGLSADRSGTFWDFWKIMLDLFEQSVRPPIIVLENVVGLLSADNFTGLVEAMTALRLQVGALVVDARYFVPHSRPRVFVVGVDERVDVSGFHTPIPGECRWFPKRLLQAHAALPGDVARQWRWWNLPLPEVQVPSVEELILQEPSDVPWFTDEETERLVSLMNDRSAEKLQSLLAHETRRIGFVYRRTRNGQQCAELRIDGLAGCLRTPSGGSSRQIVVECDNGNVRARLLSVREAARLMGVPDTYELPENYNDGYHAMGDGVAVPVVSWLSERILAPLASASASQLRLPSIHAKGSSTLR